MFEQTIASLGVYLAKQADIPTRQIVYSDREAIFHFLSKGSIPLTLPAIAYAVSDISDPQKFREQKVIGDTNATFSSKKSITLLPLQMPVSIVLMASNLVDYFDLIKSYWSTALAEHRQFDVEIINDDITGGFTCELENHSGLNTPPGGREGKDFDRGKYFVIEGSFEINTYAAYYEDVPIIRKIGSSIDWGGIKRELTSLT